MMERRREMLGIYPQNSHEVKKMNKNLTKIIRVGVRKYNSKWVTKTIVQDKNRRILRSKISIGKNGIITLENEEVQIKTNRNLIAIYAVTEINNYP